MRKKPERLAWTVLWVAFLLFCALVTGVPLAARSYLLHAAEEQEAQLQVIEGTVLVQKPNGGEPIGVTTAGTVSPGDEVITDDTSQATLDLFERSHVTLYREGKVTLERAEAPRYPLSEEPNQVALKITGGIVRVGVALPQERATEFRVATPHTEMVLDEGSYRIEVANERTQVTVLRGRAAVGWEGSHTVPGDRVDILQGSRTWVDLSGEPAEPLPAAQNLVVNGNFQDPLATNWITNTLVYTSGIEPPRVEVAEDGGRQAARLVRRAPDDGIHSEVAIQQRINHDVRDFTRLVVSLDVQLNFQSLSGGGQLSSEFPIIVRLDYKDRWGNDKFWTHGFYYQNRNGYPIASDPWGQPSGEKIPRGVWYPYESGNLLELLGDNRPAQITGLTVYASGWNYDSLVSEIQLIVE
jgi:hypothetical protein